MRETKKPSALLSLKVGIRRLFCSGFYSTKRNMHPKIEN